MAGSVKWFVYTTDAGADFALKADESNTEAVNAGAQDFPDTGLALINAVPRNVKPRHLIFKDGTGRITRKVYALTSTIYNGVLPGSSFTDPVSNTAVFLARKVGEKITIPFGQDTGLNDGDLS